MPDGIDLPDGIDVPEEIDLPDGIDPTSESDPAAEIDLNDPPSIVAPGSVIELGDAPPSDAEGSDPRSDAGVVESEPRRPESPEIASSDDAEVPERNNPLSESDTPTDSQSEVRSDQPVDSPDDANERADLDTSASVRSSEFRSAVVDAAARLSSLASVDRTDPAGRRSMALAYRAVARVASLADPEDRQEMSELVARVRDSGQLETFGRVAPEWFRVPAAKRGSDGILLVGEMRRIGDGWVIRAGEDATIDVIAPADRGLAELGYETPGYETPGYETPGYETLGGDETSAGPRGVFLGRIVTDGDGPTIELLSAEPL